MEEKVLEHFEGKVVRKDLTSLVKGSAVVPTYVLEYLLGQNCAVNDEDIIRMGIEKVKKVISQNYVHPSEAELVKSLIRDTGRHKIIDKINVNLNDKKNIYEAAFAHLNIRQVPVADRFVKEHQKLLGGGGVWCIITMSYSHAADADVRWIIDELKPIQIARVDIEQYIESRSAFSSEAWMDLMLHSIGLDPEYFNRRDKLIQLSRLIPHAESNFNFIELGPKGTGKSHVYSELSPHGVLISGSDVTQANLFVNNNGNRLGLVNYWDVVAMDEFEQEQGGKRTDPALVKTLQNYMANRSFNRGKETYHATASQAFVGNTKKSVPYMLKNSHLFESIPLEYLKGAFLDRMHLYIPGWEVKVLKESVFSGDYGFIVDYLAEIFRELRKVDYSGMIDKKVEMDASLSKRDKEAIRKTFSGLAKLIYPDKKMNEEEFYEILDFAIEGRRRVKDQLFIIDETFRNSPVSFKYVIKSSGKEVEIDTLENLNHGGHTPPEIKPSSAEYRMQLPEDDENQAKNNDDAPADGNVKKEPEVRSLTLRDNQTGVSYQKLFGDYLRGAKKVEIIDPYIRYPHQVKNFQEFCLAVSEINADEWDVNIHLITWNDEEFFEKITEIFEELQQALRETGIEFTWEFQEHHDRIIMADNGWQIHLGRGLDIFMPPQSRFDIANYQQEKRKCKATTIAFMKN